MTDLQKHILCEQKYSAFHFIFKANLYKMQWSVFFRLLRNLTQQRKSRNHFNKKKYTKIKKASLTKYKKNNNNNNNNNNKELFEVPIKRKRESKRKTFNLQDMNSFMENSRC